MVCAEVSISLLIRDATIQPSSPVNYFSMNPRRITCLLVATLVLHLASAAQEARCVVPIAPSHDHHASHHSSTSLPPCSKALTSCSLTVELCTNLSILPDNAMIPRPNLHPPCANRTPPTIPEVPLPRN